MIKVLALAWMLALAACGGSGGNGGDTPAPPVPGAEGLWIGSTNTSRSVTAIVLDDGTYWILYSLPSASSFIAGFVQGTGSSLNGNFSTADALDFNLEGRGISNATLSANYVARQSFNGSVSYPNLNPPFTFTSSYNTDYDQTPSASAIAGNYLGIASVAGSDDPITLAVSAQGIVAGTGVTSGCQYLGAALPRKKGNLYDLSLVIGGGAACANSTSTVTGIAYFDANAKRLYLAALNKSRSNGLLFTGLQP